MTNKTIQFFAKNQYGQRREYVVNECDAKIIQQLTGQKTIDGRIRELLRDLTSGFISFQEAIAPN